MLETKNVNKVQEYLIRIISRFFDSERIDTENSIEAIVVESLRRFHESIANEVNYVFSVNGKKGKVTLTAEDIMAEEAFSKKSSFNKDFGLTSDTIVAGNDNSLSNARQPLEHGHLTNDIKDLIIEELNTSTHSHNNKNVLDILKYTGVNTIIDLIIIEQSQSDFAYTIDAIKKEISKMNTKRSEILLRQENLSSIVDSTINEYKNLITKMIKMLKDDYGIFIDEEVEALINDSSAVLEKYKSNEIINKVQAQVDNSFLNNTSYEINELDCQKSTAIKYNVIKDNGSTKDIFATMICSYEYEIPKSSGQINIDIKAELKSGENILSIGQHILDFYGTNTYEVINDKTKIKVSLCQSKIIRNVPNGFIIGDNKIFALSLDQDTWENSVAGLEDGFGRSMAVIHNEYENDLIKSFGDAWIRGALYNESWVWYYGPVDEENELISYSNWKSQEPINDFAIYNPDGWTTGSNLDLKKSIIEYKFDTPNDKCNAITFITKVRKDIGR